MRLHLSEIEAHVRRIRGDELHLGDYRCITSAGTSGRMGIFVYDRSEWREYAAVMLRRAELMGLRRRSAWRPRAHRVVDQHGDPVPTGVIGAKLLITSFVNRTQPLLRYELTDRASLSTTPCPCGLPFARVVSLEGRSDNVLRCKGADGRASHCTR